MEKRNKISSMLKSISIGIGLIGVGIFLPMNALAQENCNIRIDYKDADISAVITQMSIDTGRAILVDRNINGRVNLQTPPDFLVCRDEAWELFQDMLRINGYAATPQGNGRYRIVPITQAQRSPGPVGNDAEGGSVVTRIFRLQFIDAQEAARNIAQINSEGAVASAIRSNNALLVVDTAANMARIAKVLEGLDKDSRDFKSIALKNATAREVASTLREVAQNLSEEGGSNAGRVSIVPVDTSNSILIRAEPATMTNLINVIRELDLQGEESNDISVIALKHADAEEILPLLREIATSGNTPNTGGGNNGGGNGASRSVISSYAATNSIIVKGDAVLRRELETIIEQLDVRRAQVLVEAIIVDISDVTARELGVQYFLSGSGNGFVPFTTNVSGQSPNVLTAAGAVFTGGLTPPTGGSTITTTAADGTITETSAGNNGLLSDNFSSALTSAALGSLLGINGFGLGGAGTFGDGNIFAALLTAVQQDTSSRVLSTPSVMTLDNQTASLSDGQEIPITTGEQIGDDFSNAFRTVNREQVGIILEVTPQITDGDTVALQIRQEISSIAGPIIATSTDLITNNSEINTTALIDNGDILVIGGLISDDQSIQEDKVPYLGDLPILGNLFKTTARSKTKNNLMIFIRPTIIRDQETARNATRRKFDYIRAQEVLNDDRGQEDFNRLLIDITGVEDQ